MGGTDRDHRNAQALGEAVNVDHLALMVDEIDHIDRDHHGNAKLQQLGRQEEVPFQIGAINDIDDAIGDRVEQTVSSHTLFQRIGGKRIHTGEVNDLDVSMAAQTANLTLKRHSRPVADRLP